MFKCHVSFAEMPQLPHFRSTLSQLRFWFFYSVIKSQHELKDRLHTYQKKKITIEQKNKHFPWSRRSVWVLWLAVRDTNQSRVCVPLCCCATQKFDNNSEASQLASDVYLWAKGRKNQIACEQLAVKTATWETLEARMVYKKKKKSL